jgi:nitrite reductase/ring-hydroxylating ferredoxin subunit
MTKQRTKKRFVVGTPDLLPGEKRIVDVAGRSVGIFNVNGNFYALHNRCPHMAGPLCSGPVTGTTQTTDTTEFIYHRAGELVRCGWHGWEFEIATGKCMVDDRMRVRTYLILVEDGNLVLYM